MRRGPFCSDGKFGRGPKPNTQVNIVYLHAECYERPEKNLGRFIKGKMVWCSLAT